jgi:uncharacterized membrane protein
MLDWPVFAAILAVGGAAYAVRAGGFVTIGAFPEDGMVARFLRLAPGNLFIAFAAAGCMEGGWPSLAGCAAALAAMAATGREWAGLAAGFAAAAATAVIVR